jgi:Tol biopolymer transport system component
MLYFECFESDPSSRCHAPDQGYPDIWVSTRRQGGGVFSTITKLGRPVNGPAADSFSDISPDGSALYFASNRPGGFGDFDLWVAHRAPGGGAFGRVDNLGPLVNGSGYDGDPAISPDGLVLIFASDRPGGSGGDLWVATRGSTDVDFGIPSNRCSSPTRCRSPRPRARQPTARCCCWPTCPRWSSGVSRTVELARVGRFQV